MSIDEEKLIVWMDQTDKKLAHLEANQMAIINGDFCDTNTEPKEPLIKDMKIRKAVRAWAEACGVDDADIVRHYGTGGWLGLRYENPNTGWVCKFEVEGFGSGNQLGIEKAYTIAELCGEGEE